MTSGLKLPTKLDLSLDFTHPELYFESARRMKRQIIYRHGPANSGKTHDALDKFMGKEREMSGLYCAPLRLMAKEVYEKCVEAKVPCDLRTGEEVIYYYKDGRDATHFACTIHCADLMSQFDVAVLDEIQLIADEDVGWAYTRALLGLQAKTIHLCGDSTALELVSRILDTVGETVARKPHYRPTELIRDISLNSQFYNVREGDCVVCFNKKDIYQVVTGLRGHGLSVSVIYGTLPPDVKRRQADLFNNRERKVLVATDAVGMGLNYCIRRIVFYQTKRRNCRRNVVETISASKAQQIAGRAGRIRAKFEKGYVTTFNQLDFYVLNNLLDRDLTPSKIAGFLPEPQQMEDFCSAYCAANKLKQPPPLSEIIRKFKQTVRLNHDLYFLCDMRDYEEKACLLEDIKMNFVDKYRFCQVPMPMRESRSKTLLRNLASRFANKYTIGADIFRGFLQMENIQSMDIYSKTTLESLEFYSNSCTVYIWLYNTYPEIFNQSELIQKLMEELNKKLHQAVDAIGMRRGLNSTLIFPW